MRIPRITPGLGKRVGKVNESLQEPRTATITEHAMVGHPLWLIRVLCRDSVVIFWVKDGTLCHTWLMGYN